jgi:leucyl aminopeptidase
MSNSLNLNIHLVNKKFVEESEIKEVFEMNKFEAKYKQLFLLPEKHELFLGVDFDSKVKTCDKFYKPIAFELGAVLGAYLKNTKYTNIKLEELENFLNMFGDGKSLAVKDLVLGITQGYWHFDKYTKEKNLDLDISVHERYNIYLTDEVIADISSLDTALVLTRSLVDDVPESINPSTLKEILELELEHPNLSIQIYNQDWLLQNKMQGVLMVGKGSVHNPIMVHAIARPKVETKKKIVLVGKGVTFDTGGNNIKVADYMKTMKMDMAGAATMFGVMKYLQFVDLQNIEVHWLSAFVENSVSDRSYKPDDIYISHSGQSIEIINTDAEGRLVLADLLSYATTLNPDFILDTATLTGACVRAVSEYYTGMMGNDLEFLNTLEKSFLKTGEFVQKLELTEVLRSTLKGNISDLLNLPNSMSNAGHITAGLFLSFFVDQNNFRNPDLNIEDPKTYSWIHLDIAGSAYNKKQNQLNYNGATGQGVRTIIDWILELDKQNSQKV